MKSPYDKHYQTENLFGEPHPKLIGFFKEYPIKGKVLDVGCGQGRNAIALARLGYEVTALDSSKVGIEQLKKAANKEKLRLKTCVSDMFSFDEFQAYDLILLDSMFHFGKKDFHEETGFLKRIVAEMKAGTVLVVCLQDTGKKVAVLNECIDYASKRNRIVDLTFPFVYVDSDRNHTSSTPYRLVVAQK